MEAPITRIEDLEVGRIYGLYTRVPLDDEGETWETLPEHWATFLGAGTVLGDLVLVFRSEQRHDPDEDLGGLVLLDASELSADDGTWILPHETERG